MSSFRSIPVAALIFAVAFLATPGRCADDPGTIAFTYPQATNRFTIGDTVGISWQFPNAGDHYFDLDLVLPNGNQIGSVARGSKTSGATTKSGAFNFTIPADMNGDFLRTSEYQFTIRTSSDPRGFDIHPSRSPIFSIGESTSCYHEYRSASGKFPTGCTQRDVRAKIPTGSSGRTADTAVSYGALAVAICVATVLLD